MKSKKYVLLTAGAAQTVRNTAMKTAFGRETMGMTRRSFLRSSTLAGAALFAGPFSPSRSRASGGGAEDWFNASIPELQGLMASGTMRSQDIVSGYLTRIDELNPLLHAVIETNPQAVSIAVQLDDERRKGHVRGPLHGIPVLVKDNIATGDTMQTTAGSLALLNSKVPADAALAAQLRQAGAVILGKGNLNEWANFRGLHDPMLNGWSARGGFTRCPYVLSSDPYGSSSGPAVAAAAGLCSVGVGTETDGSILAPSDHNSTFGLKPTVGLIPGEGVIPLARSQDTAGPIARTVTDAAILLGALKQGSGDYTGALERGALAGARLAYDEKYFNGQWGWADPTVMQNVLDALEDLGATILPVNTDPSWVNDMNEIFVFLYEFKAQIAEYLATLQHCQCKTLADLIEFNNSHCRQEMKYFGQEVFEYAEAMSGDLKDPFYLAARAACILNSRTLGIDAALNSYDPPLDVLIAPTMSAVWTVAAVAGYPSTSLPVGFYEDGRPMGFCMAGGPWQEAKLLAFAYDLEQELNAQRPPRYLSSVPPEPPDAGICTGKPKMHGGIGNLDWRIPHLL